MNVTDTSCKEVDSKICNSLALLRISALAHTNNTIFLATDGTNLCLKRHVVLSNDLNQLFSLSYVLIDRIMRSVEHNGRETSLNTFQASIIAAVVKMKSNRNSDVQLFHHTVNHTYNSLITCHVFTGTLGNTKDYRRVELLSCLKDSFCPLKVVDVELTNCIMACFCFFQHFCCVY